MTVLEYYQLALLIVWIVLFPITAVSEYRRWKRRQSRP